MAAVTKARDKFFWMCVGFGAVMSIYFVLPFFRDDTTNMSDFRLLKYENQFEINVPKYFLKRDSIYQKAVLQFSDYNNEIFFVIVSENKADLEKQGLKPTLAEYTTYVQTTLKNAMETASRITIKESKINGLPSLTNELDGVYAGQNIYYIFTVFNHEKYFYQVICWAKYSLKPEVKKDIYTAIQSFKTLE